MKPPELTPVVRATLEAEEMRARQWKLDMERVTEGFQRYVDKMLASFAGEDEKRNHSGTPNS